MWNISVDTFNFHGDKVKNFFKTLPSVLFQGHKLMPSSMENMEFFLLNKPKLKQKIDENLNTKLAKKFFLLNSIKLN